MRLALACAVALTVLGPSTSFAWDCTSHCSSLSAKCKATCAEKPSKECQRKCAIQSQDCLPTCNIVQRNKNDPARAEQEMRAYMNNSKVPGNH